MAALRSKVQPPPTPAWNGVSLGGWLLLEPGPSYPLFADHPLPSEDPDEEPVEARCEWDLLEGLTETVGAARTAEIIQQHRERHISKQDFEKIRACGMNAVRLPFGFWVVVGPRPGEPYVGPGLEYIDRAVQWAEETGLQIVLDLHGCPGGESGEAPCGRRQRPYGTWDWTQWDFAATLKALEVVVQRYNHCRCVTGVAVCNEPSNEVPLTRLCQYYDEAVTCVRRLGMPASRVAVVLPVFQRPEDKFARKWYSMTGDKHQNICFDIHCYHCFENEFNGKSLAQQMRAVEDNEAFFKKYPIVVGEWSLSLGICSWATCGNLSNDEVYTLFGRAQKRVLKEVSHGHFFWNWTECPDAVDWNYQLAFSRGMLTGPAPQMLPWNKAAGPDPLEMIYNPCDGGSEIRYGDKACLRVFYGRYLDVFGSTVRAQWCDKGTWQEFVFCPAGSRKGKSCEIKDGDVVHLRTHNGRHLAVKPGTRELIAQKGVCSSPSSKFVVHIQNSKELRHTCVVFLENKSSRTVVDADDESDLISARFTDHGEWQKIVVEKAPSKAQRLAARAAAKKAQDIPPTPKNRRRVGEMQSDSLSAMTDLDLVGAPAAKRQRLFTKTGESPLCDLTNGSKAMWGRSSSAVSLSTTASNSGSSTESTL